jgi:NADH:ubiquinone reductase (H+-translocating)
MNNHHVVITGGGFAGVWAALGAAALREKRQAQGRLRITLVSPDDALVIRPRLYEADLSGVRVPLSGVLSPVGVEQREARVVEIDHDRRRLTLAGRHPGELDYDQLVLCPGSTAQPPGDAPGIHCADSYEQAIALQRAVARMRRSDPDGQLSATVVGAGFTGIELAAELASMLRGAAADTAGAEVTVNLIDQAPSVAPEFGPTARGVIEGALRSLDVSLKTGARVAQLDDGGVTLASGERLDSTLTVWAGGPRASALNEQLGVELDAHGRLPLDRHMASSVENVWAAGDSASVSVDGRHVAMMSCQHATPQGCQAGHNAAAALLGVSPGRYHQPLYLTCLDLGPAGALVTCDFERERILATGERAKRFKRFINRSLIYPPAGGDASALLALGKPASPGSVTTAIQRLALRSHTVRGALISRGEDRAAQYSV